MKIMIIEDERLAALHLQNCLENIDRNIEIAGCVSSVKEAIGFLQINPMPDLIMADIMLSDGLSFSVFKQLEIKCPVVFITAYDKYLQEAFEFNSIDYLTKPVDEKKLAGTIQKFKTLRNHFITNYEPIAELISKSNKKRSRLVVKKGLDFQTLTLQDIACFFTENKTVFVIDSSGKKYLAEKNSLTDIEEELDKGHFFRVNRKYIVNAKYIAKFRSTENSKIIIDLLVPVNETIIVSQENAPFFKKWINEV